MSFRRGCQFVLWLAITVAPGLLHAQVDVIRGRVTNVDGEPLPNVRVSATSIPGNVTRTTRTDGRGGFRLAFPGGQGDYMMSYSLIGYALRQFQIKRALDEDVLLADTRLQPMQLDTIVTSAPVQQRIQRNDTRPGDVGGTERGVDGGILAAEKLGNIPAMAASLPGVVLVPGANGAPDGYSVLGLGADANLTTLNGMAIGANGLPRDAAVGAALSTSPYDASRGGFSGANFSLTSQTGTNYKSQGMSLVAYAPQSQWTDRAARALGTEATNVSFGGMFAGPIRYNRAFYNISFQADHNAVTNQTLLNTGEVGFRAAGVALDSVSRLLGLLMSRGIPTSGGPNRVERYASSGSFFGSLDFQPPNAENGNAYSIAFNGNAYRQSPVGGATTQLQASSGDYLSYGGGVQLLTNRYFGLVLSESAVGAYGSRSYGAPYVNMPLGRVRVNSVLEDGTSSVQNLVFGGSQGLFSQARSLSGTLQNTLSWFDDENRHRVKLSSELLYDATRENAANNLLGTFSFNSLSDFEASRPASFTRQLSQREREVGTVNASLSIGDSWRRSSNVQVQYGLRLDQTRFLEAPQVNTEVERLLGVRNDRVPAPILLSPRVGFSWTLGQTQDIAAFAGAFTPPRAIVRGGIGVFTGRLQSGAIGTAIDNTGLSSGIQQLVCTGDAVPLPDWKAFAAAAAAVPARCADGSSATAFSNASPNVVLFADGFRPQRSVRSNLSWQGPILDARFSLNVEVTWSLALNQQQSVDLNVRRARQFSLDAERGRPVYVATTSLDAATGAVASRDGRVTPEFNRVSQLRSDLSSQTRQLSLQLSPIQRTASNFGWNGAYTYTHVRERVGGFQSTAGDPFSSEWARGGIGPHQLSYTLRYNVFNYLTVTWGGQFRSGAAFTPLVAGDINGDGYGNDRAFIYDASAAGHAPLAADLKQLMGSLPSGTRDCLQRQVGRIAERNSCRAPWSSTATLNITLDRARFHMPNRAELNFSLSNPLGAADLLVNGSGSLKGWGQTPYPDQALFYVRGFDPTARRFRYEVNQRFGQTRPQFVSLRAPVTMTVSLRIDLGPSIQRQYLDQQLAAGRRTPGRLVDASLYRLLGTSGFPNPLTQLIRQQDQLQLTAKQADSIAAMNRRYMYRVDSLWTPTARLLASLPQQYSERDAHDRFLQARRRQLDMLIALARTVNALLTPDQKRRLPPELAQALDPRVLELHRDGTGMYVTGIF